MPETTTTTEPVTTTDGGESSKELNFRRLEEERDRFKAEAEELRPFRDKELVRSAGFDPDSGEGKSLMRDLGAGVVKADEGEELSAVLATYAETEYGWKPTPTLTPAETTQVSASQRQANLAAVSTSEAPVTITDQIAEAEKAGDHRLARALKAQVLEAQRAAMKAG